MTMHLSKGAWLGAVATALALFACNPDDPTKLVGGNPPKNQPVCPSDGPTTGGPTTSGGPTTGASMTTTGTGATPDKTILDERVLSYNEALRTAALKLVGRLPTLDEIEAVRTAEDPKKMYETYIDQFLQSPRFASAMVRFWQNTFRMGGPASGMIPNRDAAPHFAAQLIVENRDYRELFTAASGTCPTFEPATGTFTPVDCANGPVTAGILSDAGLQHQYYSFLGFRRVRFIQETFVCRKLPAEYRPDPIPKGNGSYTSPWPFESIGDTSNGGRVGFQDTTSAICANCHTTMNHRVPLLAVFNEFGMYVEPTPSAENGSPEYSVLVPITDSPKARLSDYLVAGETPGWKFGKPAPTLAELGQHMAEDDEVARCAVVRAWNFGFSKGDAVYDLADIPDSVIKPLVDEYKANGHKLRDTIRSVFVHEDFVRY
jgi:hypothetical protein